MNSFRRLISSCCLILLATALVASLASCAEEANGKMGVVVTILPQADFVESIGGEEMDVTVMVPPGANPHTYEPTPSQMAALSRAKMYVKVGSGIDFELVWMEKLLAVNKDMMVIDCSQGIELQGKVSEHGTLDPHIWMSPLKAKAMVQNICDGLIEIDPENSGYYQQNCDSYLEKLAQLDYDIRTGLSGVKDLTTIVYHPAFGYFAQEYNLTMLTIEEEGKEPRPAALARLIEQAKERDVKVIFTSPQFNPQSARVIADAIGGRVVSIDPLARNYIMNMRILLGELIRAME